MHNSDPPKMFFLEKITRGVLLFSTKMKQGKDPTVQIKQPGSRKAVFLFGTKNGEGQIKQSLLWGYVLNQKRNYVDIFEKLAIGISNMISTLLCKGHQQAQNVSGRSVFLSFDPCKFDLLTFIPPLVWLNFGRLLWKLKSVRIHKSSHQWRLVGRLCVPPAEWDTYLQKMKKNENHKKT